jgi:hypothetical protein
VDKLSSKNFSHELKNELCVEGQIEKVSHPLVKQVIAQVLAEKSIDASRGSTFGEGGGG